MRFTVEEARKYARDGYESELELGKDIMNNKITALKAREISMERLIKKRTISIDHIEKCVCDEIIEQAKKGYYFAKFDSRAYVEKNQIGTMAVNSFFYEVLRPRLEERGFVVECPPCDVFSDGFDVFLIHWDE